MSGAGRDLVIVGGGPAGLATAIFGALAGLRVTVLESRRLPADKACGEGVMPGGVALLRKMGVHLARGFPFEGVRYVQEGSAVEARFRSASGLALRRTELSWALARRALALGVEIVEGSRVEDVAQSREHVSVRTGRGSIETRWLVAADGLRSALRRSAGLERRPLFPAPRRFGVRRHFRIAPWSSLVEVHWIDGAEAYVTPIAEDEVGVAFLWHGERARYHELLGRFPALSRRLDGVEVVSRAAGAGPLRQRARGVTRGRLALVGDAAGYVDALTGEGLALGFRSADALVRSVLRGSLEPYAKDYWRLSRRYRAMTELTLTLARHPRLRRRALRLLARRPSIFARFLDFHDPGDGVK